jgi:DNA-binding CsgD family transcriptional regulator
MERLRLSDLHGATRFLQELYELRDLPSFQEQLITRIATTSSLKPLGLSRREAQVMTWIAQGKTNAETALILQVSRRTVDKHLEHIYTKLGVETRMAAAARGRAAASGEEESPPSD